MSRNIDQPEVARFSDLVDSWEAQQDAYVHFRRQRYDLVVDVLEEVVPPDGIVVDLACGLGSFSRLILERLPTVRCIGVDFDPALLAIANHNLEEFVGRATLIDANLLSPDWTRTIEAPVHGVVSSTALHWLPAPVLMRVYQELSELLVEGGIFMNADHLELHQPDSLFARLSAADDLRTQEQAFASGVPDWGQWWQQVAEVPELVELVERRHTQLVGAERPRKASPALHVEALKVAGFREAGILWQYLNDYVVYASR